MLCNDFSQQSVFGISRFFLTSGGMSNVIRQFSFPHSLHASSGFSSCELTHLLASLIWQEKHLKSVTVVKLRTNIKVPFPSLIPHKASKINNNNKYITMFCTLICASEQYNYFICYLFIMSSFMIFQYFNVILPRLFDILIL